MTPDAERQHLELERQKIRQGWWGILATVASIAIASFTIWIQLKSQAELMSADLFLNSTESACTFQGKALAKLGGNDDPETERELEREWSQVCGFAKVLPPAAAVQRDLAELLVQYPSQRSEILEMYRLIYSPKATWIDRIEEASA